MKEIMGNVIVCIAVAAFIPTFDRIALMTSNFRSYIFSISIFTTILSNKFHVFFLSIYNFNPLIDLLLYHSVILEKPYYAMHISKLMA